MIGSASAVISHRDSDDIFYYELVLWVSNSSQFFILLTSHVAKITTSKLHFNNGLCAGGEYVFIVKSRPWVLSWV